MFSVAVESREKITRGFYVSPDVSGDGGRVIVLQI